MKLIKLLVPIISLMISSANGQAYDKFDDKTCNNPLEIDSTSSVASEAECRNICSSHYNSLDGRTCKAFEWRKYSYINPCSFNPLLNCTYSG